LLFSGRGALKHAALCFSDKLELVKLVETRSGDGERAMTADWQRRDALLATLETSRVTLGEQWGANVRGYESAKTRVMVT